LSQPRALPPAAECEAQLRDTITAASAANISEEQLIAAASALAAGKPASAVNASQTELQQVCAL
jgi:hypothetical protein